MNRVYDHWNCYDQVDMTSYSCECELKINDESKCCFARF